MRGIKGCLGPVEAQPSKGEVMASECGAGAAGGETDIHTPKTPTTQGEVDSVHLNQPMKPNVFNRGAMWAYSQIGKRQSGRRN